jgi:uncharacterized protein (DUF1330 family)
MSTLAMLQDMTEENTIPDGFKRCECGGCDALILAYDKRHGVERRFKHGHHARGKQYCKGKRSANWKGGRVRHALGYILVYSSNHPNKHCHGYVLEHRLVMEQHLGRYLVEGEDVHHINGNKEDNRIENLVLLTHPTHVGLHQTKDMSSRQCYYCKRFKTSGRRWYYVKESRDKFQCHTCYHKSYNNQIQN